MDAQLEKQVLAETRDLISRSGFPMLPEELDGLEANDLGMGNFRTEGLIEVEILRSPKIGVTVLVLLPDQTLPQHAHPSYEGEKGKEETIRVVWGQFKIYIPGTKNNENMVIPAGKEKYYTALHEIVLNEGEQYRLEPNIEHWFQAGHEGAVTLEFENTVDQTKNIWYDPSRK